jgi:histidine triad (HIT) family protein
MTAPDCVFCRIARGEVPAVVLHEEDDVVAFLDIAPIRPEHTQIVPRSHVPAFEELPPAAAARILALAQQLARRMKAVYRVDRVAFLFTGGDVPHVHAHVVPMHQKTDITSARYIVAPAAVSWGSEHLAADGATLLKVREELGFRAEDA